ncbi:MAG TPA: nitroreductase [Gaiellaceae bacterium]|nr:nitroreductase [Gaiellaceae bacterium]
MDVETAIRTRRTHKQYGPEPVDRATLEELLDLARFAPNHHLTQPWRFRMLGAETLARLKEAAGPKEAAKLGRAPTLVVVSAALAGDPLQDEEDLHATACAVYAVLLAATARGLASYWRTPAALRDPSVCRLLEIGADERVVALLHLGPRVSQPPPKEREPLSARLTFLP